MTLDDWLETACTNSERRDLSELQPLLRKLGPAILSALGRKRSFLKRGGIVDEERAADTLLRELRSAAVGQ